MSRILSGRRWKCLLSSHRRLLILHLCSPSQRVWVVRTRGYSLLAGLEFINVSFQVSVSVRTGHSSSFGGLTWELGHLHHFCELFETEKNSPTSGLIGDLHMLINNWLIFGSFEVLQIFSPAIFSNFVLVFLSVYLFLFSVLKGVG